MALAIEWPRQSFTFMYIFNVFGSFLKQCTNWVFLDDHVVCTCLFLTSGSPTWETTEETFGPLSLSKIDGGGLVVPCRCGPLCR